ncbi:hypothetical protein [Rheinheimera sp.]|uniref:hypothetical protein n=1 Tax=Rheinheimera sp. TaxID=1869214 RepID=UPI00307F4500
MTLFWKINTSLAALYGAICVGGAAALMHLWQSSLTGNQMAVLLSAGFILTLHSLALLALGAAENLQQQSPWLSRLVAVAFHLGSCGFVFTLVGGVFGWSLHFGQLAPLSGQLLILSWLLLAFSPWIRK